MKGLILSLILFSLGFYALFFSDILKKMISPQLIRKLKHPNL